MILCNKQVENNFDWDGFFALKSLIPQSWIKKVVIYTVLQISKVIQSTEWVQKF